MPFTPRPLRKLKDDLDNTSDFDLWLSPFDKKSQAFWAEDCAEHVLIHFKSIYPVDDRPWKAIGPFDPPRAGAETYAIVSAMKVALA